MKILHQWRYGACFAWTEFEPNTKGKGTSVHGAIGNLFNRHGGAPGLEGFKGLFEWKDGICYVWLADQLDVRGQGKSVDEAVGKMFSVHGHIFGYTFEGLSFKEVVMH